MEKIFGLFSDTLSKLYMLLPNIIFAFMIDVKVGLGTLHTALPFILLYSFQKMGVFTLNSFGKITNYTKVLRLNLDVALGGVSLAIIGTLFKQQILLDLSGILVGTGLSCLPTLIKKGLLLKSSKLSLVLSFVIVFLVGINIKYFSRSLGQRSSRWSLKASIKSLGLNRLTWVTPSVSKSDRLDSWSTWTSKKTKTLTFWG